MDLQFMKCFRMASHGIPVEAISRCLSPFASRKDSRNRQKVISAKGEEGAPGILHIDGSLENPAL